jgi:ComF family protein
MASFLDFIIHWFRTQERVRLGVQKVDNHLASRTASPVRSVVTRAAFLDLLFPRTHDWEDLPHRVGPPVLQKTPELRGRGLMALDSLRAATSYDRAFIKTAIKHFKYRGIAQLTDEFVALMLARTASSFDRAQGDTVERVLCPVPLHWSRRLTRGFNQAELLAQQLSKQTNIPMRKLLTRIKPTGTQVLRARNERLTALNDAFRISTTTIPKHIILIDDISTTGATLDACAKTLKAAGAKNIEGWVVAHG